MPNSDDNPCALEYPAEFDVFRAVPCFPAQPLRRYYSPGLYLDPDFIRIIPRLILDRREVMDWGGFFQLEGDLNLQRCWIRCHRPYATPRIVVASTVGRVAEFIDRIHSSGPEWQIPHTYEFLTPHTLINLYLEFEEWPENADAASAEYYAEFVGSRRAGNSISLNFLKDYMARTLKGASDGQMQMLVL